MAQANEFGPKRTVKRLLHLLVSLHLPCFVEIADMGAPLKARSLFFNCMELYEEELRSVVSLTSLPATAATHSYAIPLHLDIAIQLTHATRFAA
jgi:hypothetical protein